MTWPSVPWRGGAALGLAVLLVASVGCATSSAPPPAEASPWIGKPMREVVRELGTPSQEVPLVETGGKLLMYTAPDKPHYVFEFGPDGRVARVAEFK